MNFEKEHLYHIYNQGNNKQKIFFEDRNYLFFLKKIKTHITPYADVLAWCLMPNHFHLMVRVKIETGGTTLSRTPSFNASIGIMLASYTRAINKQQNTTGSLFRSKTKAECLNCFEGLTPSFFDSNGVTKINISNPEVEYSQVCFNYIHQNPVKAKLVKTETDWEFSSAKEYYGNRSGNLINKKLAKDYLLF